MATYVLKRKMFMLNHLRQALGFGAKPQILKNNGVITSTSNGVKSSFTEISNPTIKSTTGGDFTGGVYSYGANGKKLATVVDGNLIQLKGNKSSGYSLGDVIGAADTAAPAAMSTKGKMLAVGEAGALAGTAYLGYSALNSANGTLGDNSTI